MSNMEIYPWGIPPDPTPPHAKAAADGAGGGVRGMGGGEWGIPYGYISILDIGY